MTAKSLEYASDASHPPLFLPEREPLLIGFYTPDWFWGFFCPSLGGLRQDLRQSDKFRHRHFFSTALHIKIAAKPFVLQPAA